MAFETLQAVLAIVLIDLALSGDNAVVIGMAARRLPHAQRRRAIVIGGTLAVLLRIVGTALVTLLLAVPYLQLAGGVILVVIAYRLVSKSEDARDVRAGGTMREAIATIVVADAAMSLENVLGVGAFALVWTAADMILEDPTLAARVPEHWAIELVATAVLLALVAGARWVSARGAMVR